MVCIKMFSLVNRKTTVFVTKTEFFYFTELLLKHIFKTKLNV